MAKYNGRIETSETSIPKRFPSKPFIENNPSQMKNRAIMDSEVPSSFLVFLNIRG
jgi:hypothetical protein